MVKQSETSAYRPVSTGIKITLCIWMGAVIFIFLIMFGPPEFWSVARRLGISGGLRQLENLLTPFLTAGYLS